MVSESASFYVERDHQQRLSPGDLVWGSARGYPAWPGKLVGPVLGSPGLVSVRWFGGGGESQVAARLLKTLSEGLEAHHTARTRGRKSRKLNSQLEKAIQEAMGELDRMTEPQEPVHRLRRNIHSSASKKMMFVFYLVENNTTLAMSAMSSVNTRCPNQTKKNNLCALFKLLNRYFKQAYNIN
uniref:PWWP domain-containing protein n=1 Tax=Timema monikensis TaxID=170555 RepID=A0A7R9EGD5_9NEOP|nr:unnamed protein product [Timema monikensis]